MKKKTALFSLHALRFWIGLASAASLFFGGTPRAQTDYSPLLAHNPSTHAFVLKLADMIRHAGGGRLDAGNAAMAVRRVIRDNPGLSLAALCAALNQMHLPPDAFQSSVLAAADDYDTGIDRIISAMITHTYMHQGKQAAYNQINVLRAQFGQDAITAALDDTRFALYAPSYVPSKKLSDIKPGAGDLYDG